MAKRKANGLKVETMTHEEATRLNIPTAENQAIVEDDVKAPIKTVFGRRNQELDPQLMWRGKDYQDWSELVVQAPALYIQEKIHPKVLIDDLIRHSKKAEQAIEPVLDLFGDFNGLPDGEARTEFYQHDAHWTNRMILGDSMHVMASLAEREGLRGQVQCIYIDPPYGIKFNSNFQWSTTSRDVKDGNTAHITREPEQVKAFRDTWRDGINSYLTYLRDRLTIARELLTDSGSVFVQIGDENVHRVRCLMDEVFGEENAVSTIIVWKTSSQTASALPTTCDFILWYSRNREQFKYRQMFTLKDPIDPDSSAGEYKCYWKGFGDYLTEKQAHGIDTGSLRRFRPSPTTSQSGSETTRFPFPYNSTSFTPGPGGWKTNRVGFDRLAKSDRILARDRSVSYVRFLDDFPVVPIADLWTDVRWGFDASEKRYVVETNPRVVQRCILMATDPGDLVLDPTCGSGTTAYAAEQWGRRWITIDTSRVSLALARARLMGGRYPYYMLADSEEGRQMEAQLGGSAYVTKTTHGSIRQGFVYERVPHITLKAIANNAEIDVIWDQWQPEVQGAIGDLNAALRGHTTPYVVTTGGREGKPVRFNASEDTSFTMPSGEVVPAYELLEWEVPRQAPADWPASAKQPLEAFWEARIGRQKEIDASIAAKADYEYLYDKPTTDNKKVRVAGPFTVESVSPHRMMEVNEHGEFFDRIGEKQPEYGETKDFATIILENLRTAGVQQAHKEDRITFDSLVPWSGRYVCAEGRYHESADGSGVERRAAVFIGPEFGTVRRVDLVEAACEAAEAGFEVLVACAFNYDAHSSEFERLGKIPVLKARMNADLHMADDLKNTGKGNLFVIFGEPDIDILPEGSQFRVRVNGVDVFDPSKGEVRSDGPDGIACWFIDTDYNMESFFVRHAYFPGATSPYDNLRSTLKAEVNAEAWASLESCESRPFDKPSTGRIAVKVINHLGDEVLKVFRVV